MIDLTPLVQAVIAVAGALITAYVVPYIKNKAGSAQLQRVTELAKIGVKAAEQVFRDTGLGDQKKEYVAAFLKQHGFTADLDAIIESAVKELKDEATAAASIAPAQGDSAQAATP